LVRTDEHHQGFPTHSGGRAWYEQILNQNDQMVNEYYLGDPDKDLGDAANVLGDDDNDLALMIRTMT
jgi:hypothetical protein